MVLTQQTQADVEIVSTQMDTGVVTGPEVFVNFDKLVLDDKTGDLIEAAAPMSIVDIPQYMIAEINQQAQAVSAHTDTGTVDSVEPVVEKEVPASVERIEIKVEGTNYVATSSRLYLLSKTGENLIEKFVSSLIVVVADARDNSSSSWGKVVRFNDPAGVKKELYIRNSDITTNGNAIVKAMVEEGLQVSTDNRMIDSLLHYLNMAPPLEKKMAICSDRIGWHDNVYLFHDNSVIGSVDTRVVFTGAPIGNHHATKGTWQQWKENVAILCKGNSLLILAVCVSFAAVLLRLLKIESGGYHIYGESSTGKSTTLYVGASVHGEPDHLFGTWRSTANGAEGRAKKCNDSLMIIDELHQSNPKEAGEAAYMIMNGKGKQRATVLGDARNVFEWRLNCLSSGEMAYAAFIQESGKNSRAGQEVRMLDISADLGVGLGAFENIHGAKDSHTFAEQLKKTSSEYYGTPIREFLHKLTGQIDRLEEVFAEIKTKFFKDYVPAESSGQVQRVASKLALAAMAGELATDMGITGWEAGEAYKSVGACFSRWLATRGTTGQQEAEKAVEQVKNFLLRHGMSRFIPITEKTSGGFKYEYPDRQNNNTNMAGFRFTNNDAYEFMVFPEAYNTEMCQGLNSKYVTKVLVERGFLKVGDDNKPQVRHRLPGIDLARVYHFTSSILSDTDEFVAAEPETEVLP